MGRMNKQGVSWVLTTWCGCSLPEKLDLGLRPLFHQHSFIATAFALSFNNSSPYISSTIRNTL